MSGHSITAGAGTRGRRNPVTLPARSPKPILTFVIAAFNAETTIGKAIASTRFVARSHVIVVDDGSSDGTAETARRAGADVFVQANAGAALARKTGLGHVESEYVVLLDSDDEVTAEIVLALELLESDEEIAAVGGRYELLNSTGETGKFGPVPADSYSTRDLLAISSSPWPPCTSVFRMSSIKLAAAVKPVPLHPRFAEDYEMLLRISMIGRVRAIAVVTGRYRAFGGKSTTAAALAMGCAEDIRMYYAEFFGIDARRLKDRQVQRLAEWRVFRARNIEFGTLRAIVQGLRKPISFLRLGITGFQKLASRAARGRNS